MPLAASCKAIGMIKLLLAKCYVTFKCKFSADIFDSVPFHATLCCVVGIKNFHVLISTVQVFYCELSMLCSWKCRLLIWCFDDKNIQFYNLLCLMLFFCCLQVLITKVHLPDCHICVCWGYVPLFYHVLLFTASLISRCIRPDSKVHGANMGPTGPRWAPFGPHESRYLGVFLQTKSWQFIV